ncbi:MAG: hypothetical protein ACRES1_05655, partial [Steroidobacteraceae bacterium]
MTLFFRRTVTAAVALGMASGVVGLAAGQAAGGRVLAKGPGYSIVATSPGAGNRTSPGETRVTDAPLEVLHEPIVCQGQRA